MRHSTTRLAGTIAAVLAFAPACSQERPPAAQQPAVPDPAPGVETIRIPEPPVTAQIQFTRIHEIQGSGAASPLLGATVAIEAVVVGDYQHTGIRGFYVQEETADFDDDPATSEGLFIYDRGEGVDVSVGQLVVVSGSVAEFRGQTQLQNVTVMPRGLELDESHWGPVEIELPLRPDEDWERYEGMLVSFPQQLTVTETYNLGRFGEIVLSQGGRLYTPTQIAAPGEDAQRIAEENARRSIRLDDGDTRQNPNPVPHLGDSETLRGGWTVTGLTGVVSYMFDGYRLQPVGEIEFAPANPRQVQPPEVGGDFRVANFNVLNYFNGDGAGGGFPTPRGASTPEEFARQRTKIVNAILAMNADVIGLNEMENDGYGPESAIQDLVNGLNEKAGDAARYAFVAPEFSLGTDAIMVALIYNEKTARVVGNPATTNDEPFGSRRPPLAASFEQIATGEVLTVVVNHLKSKGCGNASGANADQGDGQGCWNAERTQAAQVLAAWLATDPTGSNDPDVLLMGDLNAYAQEDPLRTLEQAGYTNLAVKFNGYEDYSYVYDGAYGSLDHALANANLLNQVTGSATWNINSDEPRLLDYGMQFNPAHLYQPDPFRSSDHDPVIVGLKLGR